MRHVSSKEIEIERLRLLLVGVGDISKDLRTEATKAINKGYRKVVFCNDCKHGQECKGRGIICEYDTEHITPRDHFCSLGERINE